MGATRVFVGIHLNWRGPVPNPLVALLPPLTCRTEMLEA